MSHTAVEYRAHMGLPSDYTVDGVLAYGTWDLFAETDQLPHLRAALSSLGMHYELQRIDKPHVGHAFEILLDDGARFWFIPVMGAAVMASYLHYASLFGSTRNILLGTVGGLALGMKNGDLVVPLDVIGNDNARMYDRDNLTNVYHPDDDLLGELRGELADVPGVWFGSTTTCEMMLAETEEDVAEWSRSGILAVEMEGALTFALSRHFSVPAVALFYVVDNLIANETMLSATHEINRPARERQRARQYEVGVNLLLADRALRH